MAFDDKADVMFNMTLLHQEHVNGKTETNCKPFDADKPCLRKFCQQVFWQLLLSNDCDSG